MGRNGDEEKQGPEGRGQGAGGRGQETTQSPVLSPQSSPERLLRVNVAAGRLGKSRETVYRWIREGKLPCEKEGPRQTRVPEAAVEALRAPNRNFKCHSEL